MTTAQSIRSTVAEVLEIEPEQLTPETCFYDLPGFDSVTILSLIVALDDVGIEIPQGKASEIRTFGDVLKLANLE
jgi:acyl carrier protein